MDHRITKQDVTGWACSCGAGDNCEVERDEFTGSIKHFNCRTEAAEREADKHLASVAGPTPVFCLRCGAKVGEQDALYAFENPNFAGDQRQDMRAGCACQEVANVFA
jgi:hypothetical protein